MTVDALNELASPADADMFRMTIDYGRWYVDPLPDCPIAKATEDTWPSCSTVKKAADKDWSFLTVNRLAALEPAELHRIADLDHTQRGDAIRSHEKLAKNIAFGRGTIVHLWAEDLAAGHEPRDITDMWLATNKWPTAARDEALIYRAAMCDFFQTYQPELVAAEYVTIHRTLNGRGYGATPDGLFAAVWRIDHELVAVDWKTRGEGSSHAAYPEEAAQIACGARAEYMIVRHGGHAIRQHIPAIHGGYVVSIKPDGARLYPIDIDKAWEHWCHLHEWWVYKQDEKASIGRVLAKRSAPTISSAESASREAPSRVKPGLHSAEEQNWRFEAKRRYDLLNDQQKANYTALKQSIDTTNRDAVFALLDDIEPFQTVTPAPEPGKASAPVQPPTTPDEGEPVDPQTIASLRRAFDALPDAAQLWLSTLTAQGKTAGVDWRTGAKPSVRRYELGRAVIRLCDTFNPGDDLDDIMRGLLEHVIVNWRTELNKPTPLGATIGMLNAEEARLFAQAADEYVNGL